MVLAILGGLGVGAGPTASAGGRDCLSYGYGCTPGCSGHNALSGWSERWYGADSQAPNGIHNCTLHVAWRLKQAGMPDPNRSWCNAVGWSMFFRRAAGQRTVCEAGINVGPGRNTCTGCRSLSVPPEPFGYLDAVRRVPGGIEASGTAPWWSRTGSSCCPRRRWWSARIVAAS